MKTVRKNIIVAATVLIASLVIWAGPYDYQSPGIQNWDSTRPADSEPGNVLGASTRQIKKCVEEWVDVEHNRDGTHSTNWIETAMIKTGQITTAKIANGAITSALLANGTTFSHETSGYETLPSGLILQWTVGTYTTAEGSQTVTFPTVFPSSVLFVTVGTQLQSAGTSGDRWYQLVSSTVTSAVVYSQSSGGGESLAVRPTVFAIGY